MTVARTDKETLPPLAQRLCSNKGIRRLLWPLGLCVLIAVLGPTLIAGVGALVFLDDLKDAHQSATEVWGLPVVAIGEAPRGWISIGREPVGVVAIGGYAVGVFASGIVAIGVVAIGTIGIGVVSIGTLALGLLSLGAVAMGFASGGAVALGRLAFGACAVGWYAAGGVAAGAYAWGQWVWGFFRAEGWTFPNPPPRERLLFPNWRRPRPASG